MKSPALPIPDHGLASNWAGSNASGGAPGSAAEFGFVGEPSADLDGDGDSALLENALGTRDDTAGGAATKVNVVNAPLVIGEGNGNYFVLTYTRSLFAQNAISLVPQLSFDLKNWNSAPAAVFFAEIDNREGTATVSYQSSEPVGEKVRAFIRLIATQ